MQVPPRPGARPTTPKETVDSALELLREEWRQGVDGRRLRVASGLIRNLHNAAVSHDIAHRLATIERAMTDYGGLDPDGRREALPAIAADLKGVRSMLDGEAAPSQPTGKLNSAVAPGRTPPPPKPSPPKPATPAPVRQWEPDAPVTVLPRIGPGIAGKLEKLGIATLQDVLDRVPRGHIDYSKTVRIGNVLGFGPPEEVTIRGRVAEVRAFPGPPPRVQVRLVDETGWARVTWFNQYIARQLFEGDEIAVSGKPDAGFGALTFTSPEWEKLGDQTLSTGRLTPIYGLTRDVSQKTMRNLSRSALDATRSKIVDPLPEAVRNSNGLLPLANAYEAAHYPVDQRALEQGGMRLAFDQLFLLQLGLIIRKRMRQAVDGIAMRENAVLLEQFRSTLPFTLTGDQRRAIDEILADMARDRPMTRLLQGDVGSGKTVVAASAALHAISNGYRAAVMAPTEILAEQHFHNFQKLYAGLPEGERPTVALLTGSTRAAERKALRDALERDEIDVLVGTHALIQDGVEVGRLGLVVVDEQHRFGVRQRSVLATNRPGAQPHVLSMTATPIPRTLNMVLNGDLDVSVIAERPPGRIPIETRRYLGGDRDAAYDLVRQEVAAGRQVFVICPLVEESESLDAKAAVAEAERLQREVFPDLRVSLIHGRMSGRDKDRIMDEFRDREADILVSTSVIEVGIDIPNATVMMIEGADRFGLAQLHQFRGRVGRGAHRSYCLLLADEASGDGEARLEMMVRSDDGFALAERDLELRGPGDFIGTRQSGLPEMSWLDGSFDMRLLDRARRSAEQLLERDPELALPEHRPLRERMAQFWMQAAPDLPLS